MLFRVPGPCSISWGTSGAESALGVTKSGVIIRSTPNWIPITDDVHGAEPADYLWAGRIITVDILGLNETLLSAANLFDDVLDATLSVGNIINQDSTGGALKITEADGSTIWKALNTQPIVPEVLLTASQELQVPITFMVLVDSSGKLFSTVPAYIS